MTGSPAGDAQVAAEAASAAATVLQALRDRSSVAVGSSLGDAGDAAAQRAIADVLRARRPGDVIFSEEAADDPVRLSAPRVWIVDPLDGTREYAEPGRVDWAVHVALWSAGTLAAGAVALPGLGVLLGTDPAPVLPPSTPRRPRLAVSRSRPPACATAVAAALDAELVPLGSAGYKVAAVLRGEVDAYLHDGGMYQWDSAAPVAVARAAGLAASRLDGSPLVYNAPDPALPDLLVGRPELVEAIRAAVAVAVAGST